MLLMVLPAWYCNYAEANKSRNGASATSATAQRNDGIRAAIVRLRNKNSSLERERRGRSVADDPSVTLFPTAVHKKWSSLLFRCTGTMNVTTFSILLITFWIPINAFSIFGHTFLIPVNAFLILFNPFLINENPFFLDVNPFFLNHQCFFD